MSTQTTPTGYAAYPTHPLCYVKPEVLEAARAEVRGAVETHDVAESIVEPLADAVVASVVAWLGPQAFLTGREAEESAS